MGKKKKGKTGSAAAAATAATAAPKNAARTTPIDPGPTIIPGDANSSIKEFIIPSPSSPNQHIQAIPRSDTLQGLRQRGTGATSGTGARPGARAGPGADSTTHSIPQQRRTSSASSFSFTFLRYADAFHFEGYVMLLVCVGLMLVRYAVSLHPHSGQGMPPMHGDYEAQRHWMEITVNLPVREWYFNGTNNDLEYWGLDYPPLSAYLAWAFGKATAWPGMVGEQFVALYTSRGDESLEGKLFMRASVLLTDLFVFIPAVFAFFHCYLPRLPWYTKVTGAILTLMAPPFLLIDHGHFQYNNVALGLVVWSLVAILNRHDVVGAACFVMAFNFKQTCLYFAPAFFCFFLGRARRLPIMQGLWLITKVGIAVVLTQALCLAPFLLQADPQAQIMQILHRLFPWDRGLYEDKVANFWCAISPLWNARNTIPRPVLKRMTAIATLSALFPPCAALLYRPGFLRFLQALTASALSFFFFSYQVHEKAVLLALLPVSLVVLRFPSSATWVAITATFSLYPLVQKDALYIPYISLLAIFCVLTFPRVYLRWYQKLSFALMLLMHFVIATVPPPARYPDLAALAISAFSFANLALVYLYCVYALVFASTASGVEGQTSTVSTGQRSGKVKAE